MIGKIIGKVRYRIVNNNWQNVDYISEHKALFTTDYLKAHENIREVEHQLGRYFNMQKIVEEIKRGGHTGDVLEFGTWQGLGLIYLSNLFGNVDRQMKFIGVDSFEGLPETSTVWRKGDFNNTSIELARRNFSKYGNNGISKDNLVLIKGWFNDPVVKEKLLNETKDLILVHLDADLGSSTSQALAMFDELLIGREKPIYFLFDDWGCHPDEVPDAFFKWVEEKKESLKFTLIKLSSTRYTRYYRLDFGSAR